MKTGMRRLVLLAGMLALSGCIIAQSPSSQVISMDVGDSQTFVVEVFPPGLGVTWYIHDNLNNPVGTGYSFTFTPTTDDLGVNAITARNALLESVSWEVYVVGD